MSEFYSEAEAREIIRQSVVDEKLIEEAARAILTWPLVDRLSDIENARRQACAAFDVFEKAQGEPSDRIPWETAEGVVTAVDLDGTVRRAHPEPSDAQVEAAAKTLANRMGDGPWEDLLDTFQDDYRHDARAVLRAAGEVQ